MRAPVSRRRGAWPMPGPVTMDLYGMGREGTLGLWDAAQKVQPLDRFPMVEGGYVLSGHYVLLSKGCAVTAHVANSIHPGMLVVQVMRSGGAQAVLARQAVEPDLLGRVIPDPETSRRIREELAAITAALEARRAAPRKRGQE